MKLFSLVLGGVALTLSAATVLAQSNYAGNGGTGFGGQIGNGMLNIAADGTGNVTFTVDPKYGNPATDTFGNSLVLYIDTTTSTGIANTSTLADDTNGATEAVSGYNASNNPATRTLVTFASGFSANYALFFDGFNINLFRIVPGAPTSALNFVVNQGLNNAAGEDPSITFPLTDLGLATGQGFTFVGTQTSETAYRSNETIGASTTVVDPTNPGTAPNAGFTGTTTFSGADVFPAPEPGTNVCIGLGAALAMGLGWRRTRRA